MPDLTLGADPEFGLLSRGALVHADNVITDDTTRTLEFGCDGSGRPVELRPKPATNPLSLVANIRSSLRSGYEKYPDLKSYKWKAGSMVATDPIGGHIHFGHPELQASEDYREAVSNVLNKTLAPCGVLIEDEEEARVRRMGSTYGGIEHEPYRKQDWGMEYRVLSSWIVSPRVAGAVLSTAYSIVDTALHDKPLWKEMENLPAASKNEIQYPDRIALAVLAPGIVNLIRRTKAYQTLKSHIETLISMVAFSKDWNCQRDMKDTWNLKGLANV